MPEKLWGRGRLIARSILAHRQDILLQQWSLPTTYIRVNDFGQHIDLGATYKRKRIIGEYTANCWQLCQWRGYKATLYGLMHLVYIITLITDTVFRCARLFSSSREGSITATGRDLAITLDAALGKASFLSFFCLLSRRSFCMFTLTTFYILLRSGRWNARPENDRPCSGFGVEMQAVKTWEKFNPMWSAKCAWRSTALTYTKQPRSSATNSCSRVYVH